MKYKYMEITLANGKVDNWSFESGDCDSFDVTESGKFFIVKKDKKTVGFYNISHVASVIFE